MTKPEEGMLIRSCPTGGVDPGQELSVKEEPRQQYLKKRRRVLQASTAKEESSQDGRRDHCPMSIFVAGLRDKLMEKRRKAGFTVAAVTLCRTDAGKSGKEPKRGLPMEEGGRSGL